MQNTSKLCNVIINTIISLLIKILYVYNILTLYIEYTVCIQYENILHNIRKPYYTKQTLNIIQNFLIKNNYQKMFILNRER